MTEFTAELELGRPIDTMAMTVAHTGSHHLWAFLRLGEGMRHCEAQFIPELKRARQVVTTVRHPVRVAASWMNRGLWDGFVDQWEVWLEHVAPRAELIMLTPYEGTGTHSVGDLKGFHARLDSADLAWVPPEVWPIEEKVRRYYGS